MKSGNSIYTNVLEEYDNKREKAERKAKDFNDALCAVSPEYAEVTKQLSGIGVRLLLAGRARGEERQKRIAEVKAQTEELRKKRISVLEKYGYTEDDADVHYECSVCGDTGYTEKGICKCLRRALAEAQLENSGLGVLCKTSSFDNFSLKYYADDPQNLANMQHVLDNAKKYAADFKGKGSGNLLLIGATGLGKTHICCAIAREVAYAGYSVLYTGAQAMFADFSTERFRNGYGQNEDITSKYFDTELLIIDDLGTEATNQFSVSCLYEVVNTRLVNGMPVIVNTNLSGAELRERYADRITSRFLGEYMVFPFAGSDIRAQKLMEQ